MIDGTAVVLSTTHAPLTREVLLRLKGVKLIQQIGVGVDSIDLCAAREFGIPVANVPEANVTSVAEYVIMAAIFLMRRLPHAIEQGRKGLNPMPALLVDGTFQIQGRLLGIVGYGAIGRAVAERAVAMGMKVVSTSVRHPDGGERTEHDQINQDEREAEPPRNLFGRQKSAEGWSKQSNRPRNQGVRTVVNIPLGLSSTRRAALTSLRSTATALALVTPARRALGRLQDRGRYAWVRGIAS